MIEGIIIIITAGGVKNCWLVRSRRGLCDEYLYLSEKNST
jgi:hypothetical protein